MDKSNNISANTANKVADESTTQHSSLKANQWQRTSPIALLYFSVKFIYLLATNLLYIAPGILLGYQHIAANPHIWFPILASVLLLIALATFLSFYYFKYRLADDHIEIRSGVFSKTRLNLPFERIQNVKLEQPIYYRPFGYTCLQLDTAGSAKQEAKVVALKIELAEHLKKIILVTQNKSRSNETTEILNNQECNKSSVNTQGLNANETLLNQRNLTDLIIHGLTNNRIWILLGGMAPFIEEISAKVISFFATLGIDIEKLFIIADKPWWQIGLYALSLTFIAMLAISLLSIAGSIISFYHYTLTKNGDRYIRRSGLLTKHEVTMRLSRLQMIIRQQDWLDMLLKRINLTFAQTQTNDFQASAQQNKIMVPSIKPHECQQLIDDVYSDNQLMNITFQPISKRFLIRHIIYFLLPATLILISLSVLLDKIVNVYFILPVFFILCLMIFCRWLRWGFAADDQYIYIRKGLFGINYYCFAKYKIQQTQFKQSWFLRRHKLANISLVLAAGGQNIPFMPETQAQLIIDESLFQVESTQRSWM
jgi:putative membrane protein